MSAVGQYIYTVIASAILTSILFSILPENSAITACVKMSVSIFMILIILSPLLKTQLGNIIQYFENIETNSSHIIAQAQAATNDEIRQVIKEQAESYILDKAVALGVDIQVNLTLSSGNSYVPKQVTISGAVSPLIRQHLTTLIAEDLGIPEESQTWILE